MTQGIEEKPEQPVVGGAGGAGRAPSIPSPLISMNEDLNNKTLDIDTKEFCEKYHLDDEICGLLLKHKYDGTDSLLDEDEAQLKTLGFKIGHIAELRWALNKMLLGQFPGVPLRNAREGYKPSISGGKGGHGGHGLQKGGDGGTGAAPRFNVVEHGLRVSVITGGRGGDGGTAGDMTGEAPQFNAGEHGLGISVITGGRGGDGGTAGDMTGEAAAPVRAQLAQSGRGSPASDTILQGGGQGERGEPGEPGAQLGGEGGLGEGPQMAAERVGLFEHIGGGEGGEGGAGNQGGRGGTGEGPNIASLLYIIDDKIRDQVEYTKLEDVSNIGPNLIIRPDLRQLLQAQGFQTVGGLFETYETDLADFEAEDVSALKKTLKTIATHYASIASM